MHIEVQKGRSKNLQPHQRLVARPADRLVTSLGPRRPLKRAPFSSYKPMPGRPSWVLGWGNRVGVKDLKDTAKKHRAFAANSSSIVVTEISPANDIGCGLPIGCEARTE